MTFRKVISLTILLSFLVLSVTGILSYFEAYSRVTATLHTVFGFLFVMGALAHIFNNVKPLKSYATLKYLGLIGALVALIFTGASLQWTPFAKLMDVGAKLKAGQEQELNTTTYEIITREGGALPLEVDLLRGPHYWHPQMAIWVTDTLGQFVQNVFVSKATAEGLFFGGRSKDNFKEFDNQASTSTDYRRVNALPIWSHNRGVPYADSMFVPTRDMPLPDGITGATIIDNFKMTTGIDSLSKFVLNIELNVAFDDNEYFSEYDYPDDEIYHSGTGQLGQPSLLFQSEIDMQDGKDFYLMELMGHGHHSGQDGKVYEDLSQLSTALQIVERIVIKVS